MAHRLSNVQAVLERDPDDWPAIISSLDEGAVARLLADALAEANPHGRVRPNVSRALHLVQALLHRAKDIPEELQEAVMLLITETLEAGQTDESKNISLRLIPLALRVFPNAKADAVKRVAGRLVALSHVDATKSIGAQAYSILRRLPEFADYSALAADRPRRAYGAQAIPWSDVLNIENAVINCAADIKGDWHKDPWGWAELSALASPEGRRLVLERAGSLHVSPPIRLDVSKSVDRTRPALILDLLDRVCFQALVDRIAWRQLQGLPDWCYGWRPARGDSTSGVYADNGEEWLRFRLALASNFDQYRHVLHLDIADFFSSVRPARLMDALKEGADADAAALLDRVEHYLHAWGRIPRRGGLPQRYCASSVLAQIYLQEVDALLARRRRRRVDSSVEVCRWMDDIWVFADSERVLVRLRDEIDDVLYGLGLEINTAKTVIMPCSESAIPGFIAAASGVDADLRSDETDRATATLERLLSDALENPVGVPRNVLGYISTRLRRLELVDDAARIAKQLDEFPQAADYLARLLRSSGLWRTLEEWYVDRARSRFAAWDWVVEAWGLMFPKKYRRRGPVVRYLINDVLHRDMPTIVVPLAAKRVAQWSPEALDALRSSARLAHSAFETRAIALAALDAGASRSEVQRLLGGHADLQLTAIYLKARDYAKAETAPDFRIDK